jgi:hypothetical protein
LWHENFIYKIMKTRILDIDLKIGHQKTNICGVNYAKTLNLI